MKKLFVLSPVALAGLAGLVVLSPAQPTSVIKYEYCLQDPSSSMRKCFLTMEQCVVMMSGQGGSCTREPYLAEANASYACASKCNDEPTRGLVPAAANFRAVLRELVSIVYQAATVADERPLP